MNKAIFLDKDGTIIKNVPFNVKPEAIEFLPGVIPGLKLLSTEYLFVVVTNQSGVAMGYFNERKLWNIERKINSELAKHELELSGFMYCPHHPDGIVPRYSFSCDCRKPMPGMINEASYKLNIDVSESWIIGDSICDIEAGTRAGLKTILFDYTNESQWIMNDFSTPDFTVKNFIEAANVILSQGKMDVNNYFDRLDNKYE